MFRECIVLSGTPSLFIVLDNIDSLFSECKQDASAMESYNRLIDMLSKLVAEEQKTVVKILVTSRVYDATTYFSRMVKDSPRRTLLKIPISPDRLHPQNQFKQRHHRLPTEEGCFKETIRPRRSDNEEVFNSKSANVALGKDTRASHYEDLHSEFSDEDSLDKELASSPEADLVREENTTESRPRLKKKIAIMQTTQTDSSLMTVHIAGSLIQTMVGKKHL